MEAEPTVMVVNRNAGSDDYDRVEVARSILAAHGPVELAETADADDLDAVLAGLAGRRLVVCGGDGSLHVVVNRLRAAGLLGEVAVGLVPFGTGNDLARTCRIPLDPEAAASAILNGAPREVDLLVVEDEDRACVNALHAGIGFVAADRAKALKPAVGEAAYPIGALAAGMTETGWDLVVEVDGAPLAPPSAGRCLLVAVCNCTSVGGGTVVAPDASPFDGALDVVVAAATGPAARAAFGVALQRGTHADRDDVVAARGTQVTIRGEPVPYNLDGELEDDTVEARTVTVEPAAWRLIVPV